MRILSDFDKKVMLVPSLVSCVASLQHLTCYLISVLPALRKSLSICYADFLRIYQSWSLDGMHLFRIDWTRPNETFGSTAPPRMQSWQMKVYAEITTDTKDLY